jgi:hypothetical protein
MIITIIGKKRMQFIERVNLASGTHNIQLQVGSVSETVTIAADGVVSLQLNCGTRETICNASSASALKSCRRIIDSIEKAPRHARCGFPWQAEAQTRSGRGGFTHCRAYQKHFQSAAIATDEGRERAARRL